VTQQLITELLEIADRIAAREGDRRLQAGAESFGVWWDCIQSLPEGPDKEEELKLLIKFLNHLYDDPFMAFMGRIDAMPEGPDKEAQQALLDKLNGTKFEKAWKAHVFGMLQRPDDPPPPRRRRQGGGRKPAFTPRRIKALQEILRDVLRKNLALKNDALVERLRSFLTNDERGVSTAILLRHIVGPVRRLAR
jgi:hypothetical protein